MKREVLVNICPTRSRVAMMEDNKIVELIVDKDEVQTVLGNVYKGIVKDVLPGMGAAFVDIGLRRTAFLHYKDIVVGSLDDDEKSTTVPGKRLKYLDSDSSNIDKYLYPGQEMIVQVKRAPVGDKGAKVVGKLSIPGRFLILLPNSNKIRFSKKIEDKNVRNQVKNLLDEVREEGFGFIVRTEAIGKNKQDYRREYNLLKGVYSQIMNSEEMVAPCCLYDQNNLQNLLIRDLLRSDTDRIVIDDKDFLEELKKKLKRFEPDLVKRLELYNERSTLFDVYNIQKEINGALDPSVQLPSGGNIMIEQTEALTVIDVNTGSFVKGNNYDNTIKIINKEAAKEAVRQIRLRNLGGIIIIDFIDMVNKEDQNAVFEYLSKELQKDSSKSVCYPFSKLGLVEISRKRSNNNILTRTSFRCPTCQGVGSIRKEDHLAINLRRLLLKVSYFTKGKDLDVVVHPVLKEFIDSCDDFFATIENKVNLIEDVYMARDHFRVFYSKTKKEIIFNDLPRVFGVYL